MLRKMVAKLSFDGDNDNFDPATRRKHLRRGDDKCVSEVNGTSLPIENWSLGGLLLHADHRLFGIGQELDVKLKFKLFSQIIDIKHRAQVVRKTGSKVALQFVPLTNEVSRQFQRVIDDHLAADFARSQI